MEADFPHDIDRIAQLAAALRELDADASEGAGGVVQKLLDHLNPNLQMSHSCAHGSA